MQGKKVSFEGREEALDYLEDFFYGLTFPNAFNPQEMPSQWGEAMRVLSMEYHTVRHYIGMGAIKK